MKLNKNLRDRKMSLYEWVKYRLSKKFISSIQGLNMHQLGKRAELEKNQKPTFSILISHLSQNRYSNNILHNYVK